MDYLTSGNACLKEGASLIKWGAFLTSLGWVLLGFLLGKYGWLSKVRPFRKTVVHIIVVIMLLTAIFAFIIIGIIKVGEGGTLTTKGWKQLDNASQKKALLTALAREWMVNDMFQDSYSYFDSNDPNLGEIPVTISHFNTLVYHSILTSNLFDLQDKDERELCTRTMLCESFATSCNEWFTFLNWDLTRKGATKEQRKELYQLCVKGQFLKGSTLKQFKESHEEIGKLLKEKYIWALKEAMLFLDEKSQKKLREKYKWLSGQ